MGLDPGSRGDCHSRPGWRSKGIGGTLGAMFLVSLLAGCIGGDRMPDVPGPEGFVNVEVVLRSFGDPPQNVTALNLSFSRLSLYEQTSKQWVHVRPSGAVEVGLNGTMQVLGSLTLPRGMYTELEGGLERAGFRLDGEQVEARVLDQRCRTTVSMDLMQEDPETRLTLFFTSGDVLGHDGEEWTVSPAFSGSLAQPRGLGSPDGPPLLGSPRCPPEGPSPEAPSSPPGPGAPR